MRESLIEKKVCAAAGKNGWLVCPKASVGSRGWPDRVFATPDRLIFVEFKASGEKPTPLQALMHQKLRERGFEVHVVDSVEKGAALFAR